MSLKPTKSKCITKKKKLLTIHTVNILRQITAIPREILKITQIC